MLPTQRSDEKLRAINPAMDRRVVRRSRWLVAATVVALLSPLAAAAIAPSGGQIDAMAQGREFTRWFYESDLAALWQRMSPTLQARMQSQDNLAAFRRQVEDQIGEQVAMVEEGVTEEPAQDIYLRKARFSKTGDMVIEISFSTDASGTIIAFYVRPSEGQENLRAGNPTVVPESDDGAALALNEGIRAIVPVAPTALIAGRRRHLVYELRVINRRSDLVTVTGVDVFDASGTRPLLTLRAEALQAAHGGDASAVRLAPDREVLLYLWVSAAARLPKALRHRLYVTDASGAALRVPGPLLEPIAATGAALGPPLRGSDWLAANGPSNTSIHRRARLTIEGSRHIAQRYAIDFIQLEGESTFRGDPANNASYLAHGQEALAVADGNVVELKDGIPENIPGADSRAVEITLETVGGNYVLLDLGDGRYAFYAHLQPGSLKVGVGDTVRRGDVLGLVGNSGNSTEPHLHFHVSSDPSPLATEGLPYVLERFWQQGDITRSREIVAIAQATEREGEIPLEGAVIAFER